MVEMSVREKIARAMLKDLRTGAAHDEPYIAHDPVTLDNLIIDGPVSLLSLADAVLEALREPTKGMLVAVDDEADDKYVARGRAYSAWTAMIDHARNDGKE